VSHEITEKDGIVLAGQRAWHGLGHILPDAFSTQEALQHARLQWTVEQEPLAIASTGAPVPDMVANIRSDTRQVLGIVGADYSVLQNEDLATFVNEVARGAENVRLETAGSLREGREVFMLARMESFDAAPGDEVVRYGLFSNSHDGSKRFRVLPTSVRVVCANTLGMALRARDGIAIKHSKGMLDQIEEARCALLEASKVGEDFAHLVGGLARHQMTQEDLRGFFAQVYQRANRLRIPANPKNESEARALRKATRVVGDWVANLDDERQLVGGIGGTAWAALNAVTQWADHERTVRVTEATGNGRTESDAQREARVLSNWVGSCADWKAVALREAAQLL